MDLRVSTRPHYKPSPPPTRPASGSFTLAATISLLHDDLHLLIPEGVIIAMFADDASIWTDDTDLNRAARTIQNVTNSIEA